MERVPVEVWQHILLKVMETNDAPIFATSCTPYTFLAFMDLHNGWQPYRKPHLDYLAQRRCLRLVCRAWNEMVLFTSHRWLQLDDWNLMDEQDWTTATRTKGEARPVEKLSTLICMSKTVTPALFSASQVLKRPASQSPLRAYILDLCVMPVPGYNPFDDFLIETTTTQDLEYTNTNTNTTLHLLSIATFRNINISISFSQISRTFTGLRSLFLFAVNAAPQQTVTLAHLEVLYVDSPSETLLEAMETWDTPALRHVFLGYFVMRLKGMLDHFLGRYAHQIESLVLSETDAFPSSLHNLPSGFWAQFTTLRLLGLDYRTLEYEGWSGWSVMPPPTHPCRYLVCRVRSNPSVERAVDSIGSRWNWHDGVRLVVGYQGSYHYYVVENLRGGAPIMEKSNGVLPEL